MDRFQEQALNLLTSRAAAKAFDLNLESSRVRDRYGRHTWGQQLLLARRLVEAGVEIITTELSGPLCGRVVTLPDGTGRPVPIVRDGQAIPELTAAAGARS